MKKCPQCGREYDSTMSFCLDDGAELLYGPSSAEEPATAVMGAFRVPPSGGHSSESKTRPQIYTTGEAEPPNSLDRSSEKRSFSANRAAKPLGVAAVLIAILIVGFFGFAAYRYFATPTSASISSIAVLPFENRSGSTDADYLSDGLTDSLIFRFSQLPNLKVSPTSSVMRYKGSAIDVAQIAKDLDVDAVLSGRLMQLGDSLDINVQLVDARTGKIVWAEQYDRKMADLLATQREIAMTLTQKMQLKLAGDEPGLAKKYTSSNEAYQLYLKGRYHYAKRAKEDMLVAIESYKKAIELDPNFALAYAATAEAYNSVGKNPDAAPKDTIPFAKAAALRALEIDPELPQAHSALADSLAIYDWNWVESERHFKRALELDPNIAYSHVAYGLAYLLSVGKANEAVNELERGVELEPLSMINSAVLASGYVYDRKYDKALAQARASFDRDPSFPLARHWFGMALVATGHYEEAISISREVAPDSPFGWNSVLIIAHAHAKMGDRAATESDLATIRELGKTRYIRPYYVASVYATLGDKEKAFDELERSFEEHDCYLPRAAVDPFMDPLRDDPRFKELLNRMNLKG